MKVIVEDKTGWKTEAVKVSQKELAKLREMPFSTIETGAHHYGLPADAKERRM